MGGEVDPVPLCDTASLEAPVWYHVISEDGTHLSLERGTDTHRLMNQLVCFNLDFLARFRNVF